MESAHSEHKSDRVQGVALSRPASTASPPSVGHFCVAAMWEGHLLRRPPRQRPASKALGKPRLPHPAMTNFLRPRAASTCCARGRHTPAAPRRRQATLRPRSPAHVVHKPPRLSKPVWGLVSLPSTQLTCKPHAVSAFSRCRRLRHASAGACALPCKQGSGSLCIRPA